MAIHVDVNASPATGAEAIWRLKNVLKAAGWSVIGSSNGTLTSIADIWGVATDVANNYAWILLQSADTLRQFTLQRGTDNTSWRITYVKGTHNVDGDATHSPTVATGTEVVLMGGGTSGAPSFSALLAADGTYHSHAVGDDTTGGFWFGCFNIGDGVSRTRFALDPLIAALTEDSDPVCLHCSTVWAGNQILLGVDVWGLLGGSYVSMPLSVPNNGSYFVNNCGTNATSLKHDLWLGQYGRNNSNGAPCGYKGASSLFRWAVSTALAFGDTFNATATKSHVNLSPSSTYGVAALWDGASDMLI